LVLCALLGVFVPLRANGFYAAAFLGLDCTAAAVTVCRVGRISAELIYKDPEITESFKTLPLVPSRRKCSN